MFESEDNRKVNTGYYFPKVKIKDYYVIIDEKKYIFIIQLKVVWEHIITFKKLQQVKEMITQLVVY